MEEKLSGRSFSVDIESFFPSTTSAEIEKSLRLLGYQTDESVNLLKQLCCYGERLAQGAPSSPVLSNIALAELDLAVSKIAFNHEATFTRYADDIVLSGTSTFPSSLSDEIGAIFGPSPWNLSKRKQHAAIYPDRLKVHGLLVHGQQLRLTKGYRNKIRGFRQRLEKGEVKQEDFSRLTGHVSYARQIESLEVLSGVRKRT